MDKKLVYRHFLIEVGAIHACLSESPKKNFFTEKQYYVSCLFLEALVIQLIDKNPSAKTLPSPIFLGNEKVATPKNIPAKIEKNIDSVQIHLGIFFP